MADKGWVYYVIKTARASGWLLLPLVMMYILTGFSLGGMYGMERVIDSHLALALHRSFDVPLVALFLLHVLTSAYVAFRRWGWVRTKRAA